MSATFLIAGNEIEAPPLEPALYIVATPIGNLRDITIRALETLAACDVLACEDTRVTRKLLDRYGIKTKLTAYHEHNAEKAGQQLLDAVAGGGSVALVSDAGTPLVSDPGYRLVREAVEAGLAVIPVPGASAVLAALAGSGLPTDDFRFVGFLPSKDKARRDMLAAHAGDRSTLIAFESPNRLTSTLAAIADTMGHDRTICVARELTKRFETIRTGAAGNVADMFAGETVKGEVVIIIAPATGDRVAMDDADIDALLTDFLAIMPASKAAREAVSMTGRSRSELYERCLALKDHDN